MENLNNQKIGFSPMSKNEKNAFDTMMSEIRTRMDEARIEYIRMSRDAEQASSVAYLNR